MEKEMENFERMFSEAMKSEVLPMDAMVRYVALARGKRLRPRLVFLSARLFGEVNEAARRTALFAELLHTATLIHDDVVDASDERRGQASVNAHWSNKAAVLAGDYLLSKAMGQLANPSDNLILKEMLQVAMAMSEGELMQSEALSVQSEKLYLEIITRKTARFIQACCVGGALSVNASEKAIAKMAEFGLNLGLVFQMRDDMLDADDPASTAWAGQLLPEYLEKTLKATEALASEAIHPEALASLKELAVFCATRPQ